VTLKSAEMSVVKSRPSVLHGANLFFWCIHCVCVCVCVRMRNNCWVI